MKLTVVAIWFQGFASEYECECEWSVGSLPARTQVMNGTVRKIETRYTQGISEPRYHSEEVKCD